MIAHRSIRSCRNLLLSCLLLIFSTPLLASAYDNDTHFWLTYYLAVKAGYTHNQATQIASANISVDFDSDTEPITPGFDSWKDWFHPWSHYQNIRAQFHALPLTASMSSGEWWKPLKIENAEDWAKAKVVVDTRMKELWLRTLTEGHNPGVFLHYLQDTFAHEGFTSWVGHAGYYYVDFLDTDKAKAERMALETLKYLVVFRKSFLEDMRSPAPSDLESRGIEEFTSGETIEEIKNAVARFRKVNPSTGLKENELVKHWRGLSDKDKRKYKVPAKPVSYGRSLRTIKNNGPAPDSNEARKLVRELLHLEEVQLPRPWLYDFNSNGQVRHPLAKRALVYVPNRATRILFTSLDEVRNTERSELKVNSRRMCLPYRLSSGIRDTLVSCDNNRDIR